MIGLSLNVSDAGRTREITSHQKPVFCLRDGYPVFEVWIYHWELKRWFVMSHFHDPQLAARGVVYYVTLDQLRNAIRALGGAVRA